MAAIVLRQFYLLRGSPARVVPLFAWVAVDIVLWGFITRYLNTVAAPGFNFVPALLGAVLLWDFQVRVMQGVTMAFFEDVWSRNFLNIFATPLSISEYLGGLVLSSIATSSVGLVVMLALATAVFGLSFFVYGLALVPFLLVLFLFGIALGIFGMRGGAAAGPGRGVVHLADSRPAFALRRRLLPALDPACVDASCLSHLLPPAYVFEGMRKAGSGGQPSASALLWGALLAIAWLLLACWFFLRIHHHAVRTGLIARYSAESLS